jgi:hypothetical protein
MTDYKMWLNHHGYLIFEDMNFRCMHKLISFIYMRYLRIILRGCDSYVTISKCLDLLTYSMVQDII